MTITLGAPATAVSVLPPCPGMVLIATAARSARERSEPSRPDRGQGNGKASRVGESRNPSSGDRAGRTVVPIGRAHYDVNRHR